MNTSDAGLAAIIREIENVARVLEKIALHVNSSAPVLLIGRRSEGASFLAGVLHASTVRKDCGFVRARCGRYTGVLLESQLFGKRGGRRKGIGAKGSRMTGSVGAIDGGSLFVEQIQNATPSVQGRLIELMTNKRYAEFKRYTVHEADVRLIASADLSLEGRVKAGLFLPKLFFTLCKSSIELNETCGSRERVLGVIDLLRAEVMPGAAIGGAQSMDWWMKEGCSAAQTPASAFLREVVTSVARRSRGEASAEEVLVATMHEMSRIASERGRVERETSPREDAVRRRDYSRHPDVAMTIFNSKRALEGGMGADRRIAVGD